MKPLLCLAFFLPLPALAQDIDCANAQYQVEMTWCAEQEFLAADADLNAEYGRVMQEMRRIDQVLPAEQRGAEMQLREAQRAWITYRDAACAAEGYAYHGGSAEPMAIYACIARVTRQRADDLAAFQLDQ